MLRAAGTETEMAPAASRLRAEPALARYLLLLRLYPVLTKAATRWARGGASGCVPFPACGR